jgi:hypothetical protein
VGFFFPGHNRIIFNGIGNAAQQITISDRCTQSLWQLRNSQRKSAGYELQALLLPG